MSQPPPASGQTLPCPTFGSSLAPSAHPPNPCISHSHLVLVLQRPTVEEDAEGVVGLDGHFLLSDAHHFIIPRAQMLLGTDDQSIEHCKERRELELPITFPFPQREVYKPVSTVLSSPTQKGLLGSCAEKDQPIHHLPNYLSFLTILSPPSMGRESERKKLSTPTASLSNLLFAPNQTKKGQMEKNIYSHLACSQPSSAPSIDLCNPNSEGPSLFMAFFPPSLISTKPSPDPPDSHHDKSPTCHPPLEPSSEGAGCISIRNQCRKLNLQLGGRAQEKHP